MTDTVSLPFEKITADLSTPLMSLVFSMSKCAIAFGDFESRENFTAHIKGVLDAHMQTILMTVASVVRLTAEGKQDIGEELATAHVASMLNGANILRQVVNQALGPKVVVAGALPSDTPV